jgi:hypothetical protein
MQNRGVNGVVFKKIVGPLPMAEIAVAWRRSDSSPLLKAFIETVRRAREELVERASHTSRVDELSLDDANPTR